MSLSHEPVFFCRAGLRRRSQQEVRVLNQLQDPVLDEANPWSKQLEFLRLVPAGVSRTSARLRISALSMATPGLFPEAEGVPEILLTVPQKHQCAVVLNVLSEIVWFPLASIANTSNLYSAFAWMNSGATDTCVAEAGRSTLNTRRGWGFSRSTMTW